MEVLQNLLEKENIKIIELHHVGFLIKEKPTIKKDGISCGCECYFINNKIEYIYPITNEKMKKQKEGLHHVAFLVNNLGKRKYTSGALKNMKIHFMPEYDGQVELVVL